MRFYTFTKPGFKARQSAKLRDANKRRAILIDVDICNDPKIMALHAQRDIALFPLYIHILCQLDLETESWGVRADHFSQWARQIFAAGAPNFKVEKRLQWLSDNNLLIFEIKEDEQTTPKPLLNQIQTDGKPDLNTPFQLPQTRVALRATKLNETKLIPPTPKGGLRRFEEFWLVWPKKVDKARAEKVWLRKKLDPYTDKIILSVRAHIATDEWRKAYGQYIPYPSTFLNGERWRDEISSASGPQDWEGSLTESQKALLERKRWLLSHSSFTLYGSHLPRDRIQDKPSSINYVLVDGKETLAKELIPTEEEAP